MSKKVLLLTSSYEVSSFIGEERALKLFFNDKVEVVASWDDKIVWASGSMQLPSILKLKRHVRRTYYNFSFSRKAVVKRDRCICQYCSKTLVNADITIDHVIPKCQGGKNSFLNCVVSCRLCNSKKADKTPEQAGMTLLRVPTHPTFINQNYIPETQEYWNKDWDDFLINF